MEKIKTGVLTILTRVFGKDFQCVSEREIRKSTVISLDVFDTLILREGIENPLDVFDLIHPDDKLFRMKRLEAAERSRYEAKLQGREDRKIGEIYRYLPGYDVRDEINTEISLCKVNPDGLAFFKRLSIDKEYGKKRVIITSDMYLDRLTIEKILTNAGYDITGIKIYVSCEYGFTKRSGRLYRKIIEEEGTRSILHIGDDYISDFFIPRILGITGCLYRRRA